MVLPFILSFTSIVLIHAIILSSHPRSTCTSAKGCCHGDHSRSTATDSRHCRQLSFNHESNYFCRGGSSIQTHLHHRLKSFDANDDKEVTHWQENDEDSLTLKSETTKDNTMSSSDEEGLIKIIRRYFLELKENFLSASLNSVTRRFDLTKSIGSSDSVVQEGILTALTAIDRNQSKIFYYNEPRIKIDALRLHSRRISQSLGHILATATGTSDNDLQTKSTIDVDQEDVHFITKYRSTVGFKLRLQLRRRVRQFKNALRNLSRGTRSSSKEDFEKPANYSEVQTTRNLNTSIYTIDYRVNISAIERGDVVEDWQQCIRLIHGQTQRSSIKKQTLELRPSVRNITGTSILPLLHASLLFCQAAYNIPLISNLPATAFNETVFVETIREIISSSIETFLSTVVGPSSSMESTPMIAKRLLGLLLSTLPENLPRQTSVASKIAVDTIIDSIIQPIGKFYSSTVTLDPQPGRLWVDPRVNDEAIDRAKALARLAMMSDDQDIQIEVLQSELACGLIAYDKRNKVCVISLRGTRDIVDIFTDVTFLPAKFLTRNQSALLLTLASTPSNETVSDSLCEKMEVHSGFLTSFDSLKGQMDQLINMLPEDVQILVTGHSMVLVQYKYYYIQLDNPLWNTENTFLPSSLVINREELWLS